MRAVALILISSLLTGCFSIPMKAGYPGPEPVPDSVEQYYAVGRSYTALSEEIIQAGQDFNVKRITIETDFGTAAVDYFQRHAEPSDTLIIVFPVLGGKNTISHYFADFFARNGYDSAILLRNEEFKNPENFDSIEEVLRKNIIRDRIVLDVFEREYGKKRFGSLGLSRGAVNVAMTAGVDQRLKYNVLALGGSDLPSMFRDSNQRRLERYVQYVVDTREITEAEVINQLRNQLRTDPKYLAKHLDARHTLMILGLFDRTVPVKYGRKLRREIGYPKTVFLTADHYVSLLYTGLVKLAVSDNPAARGPFTPGFIDNEALDFFNDQWGHKRGWYRRYVRPVIHFPLNMIGQAADAVF